MTKIVFPIGKYESTVTTPFPGNSVDDNLTPIPAVICVTIPDKAWPLPKYVSASTVFAMTVSATDTFVAEINPTVAIPETVNCVIDPMPPITFIYVDAIPSKVVAVTTPVKIAFPSTSKVTFGFDVFIPKLPED